MLLDEVLSDIHALSTEIKEHYDFEHQFYSNTKSDVENIREQCTKIRDDKSIDSYLRWLAYISDYSLLSVSKNHTAFMMALNMLTRLSIRIDQYTTIIANDLLQVTQQTSIPATDQNAGKITEIEEQLTKLNEEFKKYSPTLKKFKRALDQTEKTLRRNR